nr:hypothetical protein BaRGS_007200 [Batillaria attramentaria]
MVAACAAVRLDAPRFSAEYHSSVPGYMVNGIRKDLVEDSKPQPFVFGVGDHSWIFRIVGKLDPITVATHCALYPEKTESLDANEFHDEELELLLLQA